MSKGATKTEDQLLYEDAVKIVIENGKASVAFLQKKLRLGYSRAARILDQLEETKVVGESNGSKPRDVLMKKVPKVMQTIEDDSLIPEVEEEKQVETKIGRPTTFTDKLGTTICKRIAEGESVRHIVKDVKMPSSSTIFRWLLDEKRKVFWEQYEKSRNIQAELMFEELVEIADTTESGIETVEKDGKIEVRKGDMLGHRRLKVDVRKWYLSKVLPKKFGDKASIDLTSGGKVVKSFNFVKPDENDNPDD